MLVIKRLLETHDAIQDVISLSLLHLNIESLSVFKLQFTFSDRRTQPP